MPRIGEPGVLARDTIRIGFVGDEEELVNGTFESRYALAG